MSKSPILSRVLFTNEAVRRRVSWIAVAVFFFFYLLAIFGLVFYTGLWRLVQPYAELIIQHPSLVRLSTSVLSAGCAWFLFWPREGSRFIGRWSDYVGLAFATFSLQYGLRFVELQLQGLISVGAESAFHYGSNAVIYLCSAFNNLLFFGAARILLNKKKSTHEIHSLRNDDRILVQPKEKLLNAFAELRGTIPAWAWICAGTAPLALLDSNPTLLWARFPDAIFSVYCLSWFGYAIAINLNVRRRAVLAGMAMVIALAYGAGQLIYATNPIIAYAVPPNNSTTFPLPWIRSRMGTKVKELTLDTNGKTGRDDSPLRFLDGAVYAMLLPMKLALFLPAFFLYLLFFIVSVNDLRPALFQSISRRKDYLSSDGIIGAIGNGIGAEKVSLFIRIPGRHELGGQDERALPLVWDGKDPNSKLGRQAPILIQSNPLLFRLMKTDGKEILDSDENGRVVSTKSGAAGAGPWLVPIKFHGGVIGALQADLVGQRKNHTTLQKFRLMADLIAPSVQDYRSLAAVEQIGLRFTRLQVDYPNDSFEEAAQRMTNVLHDVLSPLNTELAVEIGFLSIRCSYPENREYQSMLDYQKSNSESDDQERQLVGVDQKIMLAKSQMLVRARESLPEGGEEEPLPLGGLVFAIPAERDEFSEPTLAAYYLNRNAIASLTADGVLDLARESLGRIIKDLGIAFSEETLSIEGWFAAIARSAQRAGLLWVVALREDNETDQSKRNPFEIVDCFSEEQEAALFTEPLSRVFADPSKCFTRRVVRLHLPKSKYQIMIGVSRAAFGPELDFESPWRMFLRDLITVADAAIDSMQKRQDTETEKLRAAQNQGVMTIAVTTGTLMHQLLNMIKDQLFATESLEEESKEPGVKMNAKCQNLLRTMRQSAIQMRELTEAFGSVTKMEGPRPCSIMEAANQATRLFNISLTQRNITIKIDSSTAVSADVPFYVPAFALANLIGNAKDAIFFNGQIEIQAEDKDDFILCHVTNSGPEIPSDVREMLFQFGGTNKKGHNGWGLYFVEKSLSENGGGIWLARSDSSGTRFTIRLPKVRPA